VNNSMRIYWANYAIIGLALAYFQFRKNKPGLISTIFELQINSGLNYLFGIPPTQPSNHAGHSFWLDCALFFT